MRQYEAQRQVKNDAPLSGDRGAPPVGGETHAGKSYLEFLERAGGGVVGGYNNFWLAGGTHVITVNGEKRSSIVIDPPDGKMPPMKPEAREAKRGAARRRRRGPRRQRSRAAAGPPGAFDGPETASAGRALPARVRVDVRSADAAELLLQQPQADRADADHRHDPQRDGPRRARRPHERASICRRRSANGWATRSAGGKATRWSSTRRISRTRRSSSGSSEKLHVVERFTRADREDAALPVHGRGSGDVGRSWTGEYPWNATNENLYEYACHEGNYSLGEHAARRAPEGSGRRGEEDRQAVRNIVGSVGSG